MPSGYVRCDCCGIDFVGSPDTCERVKSSAVEAREGPEGFQGWALCPECAEHGCDARSECDRPE